MPTDGTGATVPIPDAGNDLLRHRIYLELDGHGWERTGERCLCGWDPEAEENADVPMDLHLAEAVMPAIREHVAEVWDAYESWRETGSTAIDALNVIWRALEPDRKHLTFGDDPQRVVDETLRALNGPEEMSTR